MDDPLDNDALSFAPYMISNEEEYPTHHTDSKHDLSWTPFSPDLHLPQPTIIPPDEDSEGVPQDDLETADPEGEPEGATLSNKDTPIRYTLKNLLVTSLSPLQINQLILHLNQRQKILHCYYAITIAMDIYPFGI